jgi:hypothetical protein
VIVCLTYQPSNQKVFTKLNYTFVFVNQGSVETMQFVSIKPFDDEVWRVRKDAIIGYKIETHYEGERYLLTLWVMGMEDSTMIVMEEEDLLAAAAAIDAESETLIPRLSRPEDLDKTAAESVRIHDEQQEYGFE